MIKNITQRVKDNGGKVIANEVTTGTGRTGKWFGYQHYEIVPDMIAIGKGIGNGYPVSVAVIDGATVEELDRKPFKYGQSHMNDPLGAAIVREVVRIITEESLIAESYRKGEVFLSQLLSLLDAEIISGVRGRGLMMAVDVPNPERASAIYAELLRRGFIVSNRKTAFRIDPPLTISEKEFGGFIEGFRGVLAAFKAAI